MINIIETNISINNNNEFIDHQSRVIEVESWGNYVDEIKSAKSIFRESILGNLHGKSIPHFSKIENLKYNDFCLSCDVINRFGWKSKKLAYNIL